MVAKRTIFELGQNRSSSGLHESLAWETPLPHENHIKFMRITR
jgi:hypothetical protein